MKFKDLIYLLGKRGTPHGHTISSFDLGDYGSVEYAQWLHPRETKKSLTLSSVLELNKFLKPGDCAIDIGAHTGDSTIPIALSVGKSGRVLALEPNPYAYEVLKKNSELNPSKTNIVPLMFAATPRDGPYEFHYSDAGFCNGGLYSGISKWIHGHAFKLMVEGRNLESFLEKNFPEMIGKVRYIKVDAEGADLSILQSLSGLIAGQRPFLKAEVYKRTNLEQRRNLLNFLHQSGYKVHRVTDESDYLGEVVDDSNLMKWRHFDIFCIPAAP